MDTRIGFGLYQFGGNRGSVGLRWCMWVGGWHPNMEGWGGGGWGGVMYV